MPKILRLISLLMLLVLSSTIFINCQFLHRDLPDNYKEAVASIINVLAMDTEFKHKAYERTAELVDTFGPRLWGSKNLERAINWMKEQLIKEGFDNVRLEEVPNVPRWVRGEERMILLSPRPEPSRIPMIGLGKSVGGNITAEVVMFKSFQELNDNPEKANGKIVFFNQNWTNYGETVRYRTSGPSEASKYGAVGCIIRSIAPKGIENPHTGALNYDLNYPKIPAAAVSLETADMFSRMITRGQKVVINLYMEAHYEGETTSHNVVAELMGSEFPNEIILLGGHIDSWDVGPQTGANDDAGGFMVCFEAIRTLIRLGLRPKRTLRFIAWSGEEMGEKTSGAQVYLKTHADELKYHVVAFESDLGTRKIHGWGYSGSEMLYSIVKYVNDEFLQIPLNLTHIELNDGVMTDTEPLYTYYNVPVMRNLVNESPDDEYYFTYHHSSGDSISVLNADDMDSNVAAIASIFYIIGDLPTKLIFINNRK